MHLCDITRMGSGYLLVSCKLKMPTTLKIILVISYVLSGLIIYSKNLGIGRTLRLILTFIPVAGMAGFLFHGFDIFKNSFIYGFLAGSITVGLSIELFNLITRKINGREFYLHAAYSSDIHGLGLGRYNKHFNWTDKLFSFILILIWIGSPILFTLIIKGLE